MTSSFRFCSVTCGISCRVTIKFRCLITILSALVALKATTSPWQQFLWHSMFPHRPQPHIQQACQYKPLTNALPSKSAELFVTIIVIKFTSIMSRSRANPASIPDHPYTTFIISQFCLSSQFDSQSVLLSPKYVKYHRWWNAATCVARYAAWQGKDRKLCFGVYTSAPVRVLKPARKSWHNSTIFNCTFPGKKSYSWLHTASRLCAYSSVSINTSLTKKHQYCSRPAIAQSSASI